VGVAPRHAVRGRPQSRHPDRGRRTAQLAASRGVARLGSIDAAVAVSTAACCRRRLSCGVRHRATARRATRRSTGWPSTAGLAERSPSKPRRCRRAEWWHLLAGIASADERALHDEPRLARLGRLAPVRCRASARTCWSACRRTWAAAGRRGDPPPPASSHASPVKGAAAGGASLRASATAAVVPDSLGRAGGAALAGERLTRPCWRTPRAGSRPRSLARPSGRLTESPSGPSVGHPGSI
jgi:hypothetical protein